MNDLYHFEMPRFWIQRHTVLPFAVNDPRVVTMAFLSEALQLPGYLYLQFDHTPEVFTIAAAVFSIWIIFALARRLGAGLRASLCAAAIAAGYTSIALDVFRASAEMLLSGAFFGASLIFLMDVYENRAIMASARMELGCSVFFFLMGCGAKNATILVAPLYLLFLAWAVREILNPPQPGSSELGSASAGKRWRTGIGWLAPSFILCGLAGLLCSGVAWNYTSNKLWFGRAGLPSVIRTTVAQDFHPRTVWTRVCRGAILVAYDTLWIPKSAREKYAALCEHTLKLLGGQAQVTEDDGQFFSFERKTLTPLKGLGLLGIGFFIPGLVFAAVRVVSSGGYKARPLSRATFKTIVLVCCAAGGFVIGHTVLRWQAIGSVRLLFACVVAGAPLSAFLLERRWLRLPALLLLLLSSAMFITYWLGHVTRRMAWDDRPAFKWIARLQNNHAKTVH